MFQGRDVPGVDESESYVYYASPGVLTSMECKTYYADVCYGWGAAQPLIMDFQIAINLDSVPLDDRNYPEGYICDKCLMHMPYGTVAVADQLESDLICIACARDLETSRWYSQPWEVSVALVRELLTLNDGDSCGSGSIIATRTDADTVTFRLNGVDSTGQKAEYCFLNLPLDRIAAFIACVDGYMDANDLRATEEAFLAYGIDCLEAMANGETL